MIAVAGGILLAFLTLVFLPEIFRFLKVTLQLAFIAGCFLLWYAIVMGWFG